jgi:hypothetical protein
MLVPPKKQRSIIPLMLRLPADLHRKLAQDAEKNDRSLNAEIVERLMRPVRQEEESKKIELAAKEAATSAINQFLNMVEFSLPPKGSTKGE